MNNYFLRRLVMYFLVFVAGLVLQFSWMKYLAPGGVAPNVILIALIFIGLMRGSFLGEVMGFFWGVSWDILSVDLFGGHALLFTLIGYLTGQLSHKWNESKVITQIVLTGICTVLFWVGMYALYQIFSPQEYGIRVNYIMLIQPFYNMLVAPIIFFIGERLTIPSDSSVGLEDF